MVYVLKRGENMPMFGKVMWHARNLNLDEDPPNWTGCVSARPEHGWTGAPCEPEKAGKFMGFAGYSCAGPLVMLDEKLDASDA